MPYERSHGRQCIVTGCFYTEKDRYFVLNSKCAHDELRKDCGCETVFKFHKFPINPEVRKVWVNNVNRKDVNEENCRKRSFVICSTHFPEGQPTKESPYPTLYMQEPCPNPQFKAELNYKNAIPVTQVQKPGSLMKDVQYVVAKLCNIICKAEKEKEREEDDNVEMSSPAVTVKVVDFPEDSLSARRHKRTIKKTFKARTFEKEKLFNRIRFGRPENRTVLLSLLKSVDLPEVKDCSVKLHRLTVDSTVKLSEWKEYSRYFRDPVDSKAQIDSDISYTELLDNNDVIIKTEEDYDELPELEFEVDNDYSVREIAESFSDSTEHSSLVKDDLLTSPPQKVRILSSPQNGEKNAFPPTPKPKIRSPLKVQFKTPAKKPDLIKKHPPKVPLDKSRLDEPRKTEKLQVFQKTLSQNSKGEQAKLPEKPVVNTEPPKFLCRKRTGKVSTSTPSSKAFTEKFTAENGKKIMNTGFKVSSAKFPGIDSPVSIVQPFKIGQSKHKGSVKHTGKVKVIRTYANEKDLLKSNKDTYRSPVSTKQTDPKDSEVEKMPVSSAESDLSRNNTSKSQPKSSVKLSKPPAISKIWTELHTHYDYTEEEEVPFSELPEIDDVPSYVVYEGEESDLTDDDEDEEEEGEVESEHNLADKLTEENCFAFTGLSLLVYRGLFGILKECAPKQCSSVNLSANDQMLLALMKLKMGLINADLSAKFNCTSIVCGKVFSQWLNIMYKTLNHMVVWKTRDTVMQEMPELYNEHPGLGSCFIDIAQISTMSLTKQTQVGQSVGKTLAVVKKFLYAVSPDGFIMFTSKLFDLSVSDACMLADCGILNKFVTGDVVYVNSNFMEGISLPTGVTFDVLPHTKAEMENEPLSSLSKTAVDRLKIFRMLRGVITVPLNHALHIIQTCAALSNLGLIR